MSEPIKTLGLGPGFYPDIPEKDYHADLLCDVPTLSRSLGAILLKNPFHAFCAHPRLGNLTYKEPSAEMDYGDIFHQLVLGSGSGIAVFDGETWRGGAATAFWDRALEEGKTPTLAKTMKRAEEMKTAFEARMAQFGYLEDFKKAQSEVTVIYEAEGARCRARFDKLLLSETKATVFDLKTTKDADPDLLPSHVFNMGYPLQEAHYKYGIQKLRPELAGRVEWIFLFVETSFPYSVTPIRLNGEFQSIGMSQHIRMCATWKQCMDTGVWPDYTDKIITIEPKPWMLPVEFGARSFLTK